MASPSAINHYLRLIRVLLAEYRSSWWFHVFFGTFLPLGLIFFLKMISGGIDTARAVFLIGGNMTISIAYGPTIMLISKIGWGKQNKEFDYWAALPIGKLTLILAMVSVYLLFALPGLAASYLVGSWVLGLPLSGGLALILIVPLGVLSLTGFGAFLGAFAKDGQMANALGNALIGVVTFLTPTMIPLEGMPGPLRLFARITPTTYVADAFRAALGGQFGSAVVYDVLILVGYASVFLWLVARKLDWRAG